jgi:hypothetical protein
VRLAPQSKYLARNNKFPGRRQSEVFIRTLAPACTGALSVHGVNNENHKALSWADMRRAKAVNGNPLLGASRFGDGKDSRNRMGFVQQPATRIASSRVPRRQVFAFVVSDEAPPTGGVIVFERALKGWIATACTHFLPSMK